MNNSTVPYAVIPVGEVRRRIYGRIVKSVVSSALALSFVGGMVVSSTNGGMLLSNTSLTASAAGSDIMDGAEKIGKKVTSDLIKKGWGFITGKIPGVGGKVNDVICPLILDALDLGESDSKMSIEDLSKQLSSMSENLNQIEKRA